MLEALPGIETRDFRENKERMLTMFHYTVFQKSYAKCGFTDYKAGFIQMKDAEVLFAELLSLLRLNLERLDFVDEPLTLGYACPLDLHCSYGI